MNAGIAVTASFYSGQLRASSYRRATAPTLTTPSSAAAYQTEINS
jgi:hypothetical protein